MGLGTTQHTTVVQTSVVRLIDDALLPDTIKTSIVKTLITNDGDHLIDNLQDSMYDSLGFTVASAYRYGASHYTSGLPTCSVLSDTMGSTIVKEVLEDMVGTTVTIDYFKFTVMNPIHFGWKRLVEDYGYNETTNEIKVLSDRFATKTYLKDMRMVFGSETDLENINPVMLQRWGKDPNTGYTPARPSKPNLPNRGQTEEYKPYIVDTENASPRVRIEFVSERSGILYNTYFEIPFTGFVRTSHYQIKYYYTEASVVKVGYFTYDYGTGVYPTIDAIMLGEHPTIGNFLPFLHLRHNRVNLASPNLHDTDDFKSSNRLAKYLKMNYQDMVDKVHENADIGDVDQCFVMLGIPMDNNHQVAIRYLFDFFSKILIQDLYLYPDSSGTLRERTRKLSYSNHKELLIKDRDVSMTLSYAQITKERKIGNVAAIGKYAYATSTDIVNLYGEQVAEGGGFASHTGTINRGNHIYRKQITANLYDEVTVFGPQLSYHIYHDYSYKVGFGADALLIPIDYQITKDYPFTQEEQLYAMAFHLVFNVRDVVKTEWYKTEEFAKFLEGVGLIVMVITFNPAGATLTQLAYAILKAYLEALVIKFVLTELVEEIGGEAAVILAAAIYVYQGYNGGFSASAIKGTPWASELLKTASGLLEATQAVTEDLMKELQKEASAFEESSKTAYEKLEAVQADLDKRGLIDPMDLVRISPMIILGESPQDYYQRTVHSGNVGILGIDAVRNYVSISLTLPKLSDTLSEDFV